MLLPPFLDLSGLVNVSGDERGLLGLALDPDFTRNGRFFVNYTDANGDFVTARHSVSGGDPEGRIANRVFGPVATGPSGSVSAARVGR